MTHSYPRLLVGVFLVVLTTAAFWQVKNNDFINYDDDKYILQNNFVREGITYQGIIWAFTTTANYNWHPLTWLSHLLDGQLYGVAPEGHHLTNLLFHLANVILLFLVFDRMTGALWPSAMVAALFALHPLHVESVAWVAERKDVLSTFFWFLTLGAYVRYTERPGAGRYLLTLLFFALGLMSKPMLVTLPFVLLLLDYWPLARWPLTPKAREASAPGPPAAPPLPPRRPGWRLLAEKFPFFLLTGLSCLLTLKAQQGALAPQTQIPFWDRVANSLVAYGSYLGKTIWPSRLAVFYPHPGEGLPGWQVGGAALVLVLITLLVIREARRRPYLPVGWLWFLGTLLPVIGLVQVGDQARADRYTYVPLIGLFIMGVWGILDLSAGWRRRRIFLAAAAGMILSLAALLTWQQVGHWRNSITLFQQAIKVTTDNYLAYHNLGVAYSDQGQIDDAIQMYKKALEIYPYFDKAYYNLGVAYEQQGRLDEAVAAYKKAIAVNPSYRIAYKKLVSVYEKQENTDEVITVLQLAIKMNPDFVEAYNKLGLVLAKSGSFDAAIVMFQKAIQLQPDFAVPYYNLGLAYTYAGKHDEAITMFQKALQIKPDFSEAQNKLKELTGK